MDKSKKNIFTTENTQSSPLYAGNVQMGPQGIQKRKGKEIKNNPPPLMYTLTKSKKPTTDLGLSAMYKFVQDQILHGNEYFILLVEMSSFSKAILSSLLMVKKCSVFLAKTEEY